MNEKQVNLEKATVNVIIELNGMVHKVIMEKDNYDAVSFLSKRAVDSLIPTSRTQSELLEFLNGSNS